VHPQEYEESVKTGKGKSLIMFRMGLSFIAVKNKRYRCIR